MSRVHMKLNTVEIVCDRFNDCCFRYWKLDKNKVYGGGANAWDLAVHEASEEYKTRMVRALQ